MWFRLTERVNSAYQPHVPDISIPSGFLPLGRRRCVKYGIPRNISEISQQQHAQSVVHRQLS